MIPFICVNIIIYYKDKNTCRCIFKIIIEEEEKLIIIKKEIKGLTFVCNKKFF